VCRLLDINDSFTSLRVTGPPASLTGDDNYVDGILNGRVITFTTGAAEGYSTRIVSHSVVGGGTLQYVIFDSGSGIDWTQVANGDEYIINGREYSGTGGGSLVGGGGVPNPDAAAMARLQMNSLQPNRIGVPRATLVGNTGYLPTSQSINEPWDAPDQQNMHLSGENGSGDIIPSYHRDILYGSQSPGTNPALIRQLTMRPFFINGNTGSTANEDFDFNFINATTGALNADSLDVDNTNSGRLDSVWIDINLPIQTDNQGRGFRPLVAYRIVDLDGRLNLNACGSDAERLVGSLDRYGSGVGPSDISLSSVVGQCDFG